MSTDNIDLGNADGLGAGEDPAAMLADLEGLMDRLDVAQKSGQPLKTAMEMSDEQVEALYALAYMSYTFKRYPQAQMLFSCLVALDPKDARYSFGLGSTLKMQEEYDDAFLIYILAMTTDMESPKYAYFTAEACWMTGNKESTIDFLEAALARVDGPPDEKEYLERARIMLENIKAGAVPPKRKEKSDDAPGDSGEKPDIPPPPPMGGGRSRMRV